MNTQDCSFQVYKVLCSYSHCVFYYLQKLRDINYMLKQGGGETSRKRALLQDDQSSRPPAKRTASEEVLQRKLTSMLEERQASASR